MPFRKGILPILVLALSAATSADAIDDLIKKRMEENPTPGVCLAVIGPDNKPDIRSYGIANLESNEPVTPDTVFRIASLSKQFCAYAAFKLIEDEKLFLSDPYTKFFPELPEAFDKVTIKDAIGHRTGIADPGSAFNYRLEYSADNYAKLLGEKPLAEEPGTTYRYNNHAYALLGILVGKVDGSSLPAVVKREVFDKVGMTNTRYFDYADIIRHRAQGYERVNNEWRQRLMIRPQVFHGSGGILSTMNDMVKYELALRSQVKLSPTVLKNQWTPVFGGDTGYGGGWNVRKTESQNTLVHSGSTFGFTSYFYRDLNAKTTILLFRNSAEGSTGDWVSDIRKIVIP